MSKQKQTIDESQLTKGQARKLNALRRTLGDEQIALDAFQKWMNKGAQSDGHAIDPAAEKIAGAVQQLREKEKLNIPRGGYIVRSGRGRVIVEPAADNS